MDILVTGGEGKFIKEVKKVNSTFNFYFASKTQLNLDYSNNKQNIRDFCNNKKFDIIIANASKYQGINVEEGTFNTEGISITLGHSYLIKCLNTAPKYFINLTTSLNYLDENYFYRAQKTFNEDYYYRFFKSQYPDVKFYNIHPGHIDNIDNWKSAAKLLIDFLKDIDSYKLLNYDFNHKDSIITKHENKTLRWE